MRVLRIVVAIAALASLVVVAAASAAARVVTAPKSTTQWAGYAITNESGTPFTSVTATWKQPKASCRSGAASAAFWVGLGGYSNDSQTIEQIGADADCTRADKPAYYAWYDLPPNPGVVLKLKVGPADVLTASVRMNSAHSVLSLRIVNVTTGSSYSKQLPVSSPDLSSAEWIAEAPVDCAGYRGCQSVPLANFGSVSFTKIGAVAGGRRGTVTDTHWKANAVQLVPRGSTPSAGAVPAGLTSVGDTFDVIWKAHVSGSQPTLSPTSPNAYVAGTRHP